MPDDPIVPPVDPENVKRKMREAQIKARRANDGPRQDLTDNDQELLKNSQLYTTIAHDPETSRILDQTGASKLLADNETIKRWQNGYRPNQLQQQTPGNEDADAEFKDANNKFGNYAAEKTQDLIDRHKERLRKIKEKESNEKK